MTTTKEEFEGLLVEMPEEEHNALKSLCLGSVPMSVSIFSELVKGLPVETQRKYEGRIRTLRKLNGLLDLNTKKIDTSGEKPKQPAVELTEDLTKETTFSDIVGILSTSIKRDSGAKLITFCGMLLAQSDDDALNLGYQSESSTGKSYLPIEVSSYFPKEEVSIIASASPTSFYHDGGQWDDVRKVLVKDLEHKILIFLDQPHFQLLEKLRPLLTHDMRELRYMITDKNQRFGLRTKNVIIRGYPSVFFCSAKLEVDEQERTRLILLSPSTDQEKLRESLELVALRKGNPEEYLKRIQGDPRRAWLMNRIRAVRQSEIREVIIPNEGRDVYDRFMTEHKYLMPRHQRDFPRIFSFIKASALLNCFNREKVMNGHGDKPVTILATQVDINAGFSLYREIELSNELGLSPYVFKIYKEVFEPLLKPDWGLSRKDLRSKHYEVFHKTLSDKVESAIILQLESAGLVEQQPDPADKRKNLIYPTVSGNISSKAEQNYIPQDSGVRQTILPAEGQPN
jgi:hypothetical protein